MPHGGGPASARGTRIKGQRQGGSSIQTSVTASRLQNVKERGSHSRWLLQTQFQALRRRKTLLLTATAWRTPEEQPSARSIRSFSCLCIQYSQDSARGILPIS